MDAGGVITDSKTTRLHNRRLWANGRRKEFEKPEWEPVTCPLRVADVVQLFSPAKKARAKRKLGSDRISKAKQTKERCRRSRPGDSDGGSDYEGCDKLSSDGKSKGKAKAKVVGFQVNKFVPSAGSGRSARSAQSAAASAQMAGIAETAQSADIGTPRKKEQRRRAGIKKGGYLLPSSNQGPC
jgi:hypothetical protein